MTISGNSFSGDGSFTDGDRYSSAAWGRGIWLNGGGAAVTISGNALTNCRTGMNLENYFNGVCSVDGNTFTDCGTGMSLGVPTAGALTSITGNSFQDVDTDINARNLTADITWDLAATGNAAVPGNSTVYSDLGYIPGNNPGDIDDPNGSLAYLSGSGADNLTFGADDNNVTGDYGGGANDVLDGGDGTDMVIYADDLANLTLTTDGKRCRHHREPHRRHRPDRKLRVHSSQWHRIPVDQRLYRRGGFATTTPRRPSMMVLVPRSMCVVCAAEAVPIQRRPSSAVCPLTSARVTMLETARLP